MVLPSRILNKNTQGGFAAGLFLFKFFYKIFLLVEVVMRKRAYPLERKANRTQTAREMEDGDSSLTPKF